MPKVTNVLGNSKVLACESLDFVIKKKVRLYDTPSYFLYGVLDFVKELPARIREAPLQSRLTALFLFLQKIADFSQENFFVAWSRRSWFCLWFFLLSVQFSQ